MTCEASPAASPAESGRMAACAPVLAPPRRRRYASGLPWRWTL